MRLDWEALLLLAAFIAGLLVLRNWSFRFSKPFVYFSRLADFDPAFPGLRARLSKMPKWLSMLGLILFGVAFIDIHWVAPPGPDPLLPPQTPKEGIAIYILVDRSDSMKDKVPWVDENGLPAYLPKIDILKKVTRDFILGNPKMGLTGRPNDLIGLVSFARSTQVEVPLTLDHNAVVNALNKIQIINDADAKGTGIGYAIYKTASILSATREFAEELARNGKPPYEIKSAVMLLVTDGFQDVNPLDKGKRFRSMDVEDASNFAKSQHIKLYIVNVDPSLNTPDFQPERDQMARTAENTGGRFYIVKKGETLQDIYHQINQLEKSSLPNFGQQKRITQPIRTFSLYPGLIGAGLVLIALAILLQTTGLRKAP